MPAAAFRQSREGKIVLFEGDGVRLLGFHAVPHDRRGSKVPRMAILLHGWHGSADSPDVVSLAQHLFLRGFEVIRLNLRDHGETEHLNRGLFHSCRPFR